MKMNNDIQIAIGYWPSEDLDFEKMRLRELTRYKDRIYDLHFAHYDPNIAASGRTSKTSKKTLLNFIELNEQTTQFRTTLLMNYLLHKDYDLILRNFKEEFYSRGVRSVVIADLELIKRMKQAFPDVHIQGSCLSYRMTEEELYEEAKEGVEIHNPAVDIIRDPDQLRKNHEAGFKQKVIWAEGCMHSCPYEKGESGHRWHIARNIKWGSNGSCVALTGKDFKHFARANWVTVERLKELSPYIEVVKLPRKGDRDKGKLLGSYPEPISHVLNLQGIEEFLDIYDTGRQYNVLDFIGVAYLESYKKKYGKIPSSYFDREFFETTGRCKGRCADLKCDLCYKIEERIKKNSIRYKLKKDRGIK